MRSNERKHAEWYSDQIDWPEVLTRFENAP